MAGFLKIAGFLLDPPVFNAGGMVKELSELNALLETEVPCVEVGSITVEPREGNPEPRIYIKHGNSLNSVGLKNGGKDHYQEVLPSMVEAAHRAGKALILNIAGFTVQEYIELADLGVSTGVDALMINFSCPNTERGRIFCDSAEDVAEVLQALQKSGATVPLMAKYTPYLDFNHLWRLAEESARWGVEVVAMGNTIPNCYEVDGKGNSVIGAGYAGGAGDQLYMLALARVRILRDKLPPDVGLIGIGGVNSGERVKKFLDQGANAIALHTAARWDTPPYEINPAAFDGIIGEWRALQKTRTGSAA